ncbi:hypothetical protein ACFQ2B_02705 [Streptomyces stramineus]
MPSSTISRPSGSTAMATARTHLRGAPGAGAKVPVGGPGTDPVSSRSSAGAARCRAPARPGASRPPGAQRVRTMRPSSGTAW